MWFRRGRAQRYTDKQTLDVAALRHTALFIDPGMASLKDRPRSGRPLTITASYRRELRRALCVGPLACGYVFTVWSVARLGTHQKRMTGVSLSETRLRQLIRAEGFVYRRPKHALKGKRDEKAFRRTQPGLARLKKGLGAQMPITNSGMRTNLTSTGILI